MSYSELQRGPTFAQNRRRQQGPFYYPPFLRRRLEACSYGQPTITKSASSPFVMRALNLGSSLIIQQQYKMAFLKIMENQSMFQLLIMKFCADEIHILLRVNRSIKTRITASIRNVKSQIANKFEHKYNQYLKVIETTPIFKRVKDLKWKQSHIYITLRQPVRTNRSYTLSYSYEYYDKKKRKPNTLFWQVQFDVIKGNRKIWLYKQQTRNHFVEDNIPRIQDILPVGPNDIITFQIPYLTSFGFSNINKLEFFDLKESPAQERLCEIENNFEWTLYQYFEHPVEFEVEDIIKCYPDNLKLVNMWCYGVGFLNYKIMLQCVKPANLDTYIGHNIKIVPANQPVRLQLKKKGSYEDQSVNLQLRVGDILLVYFTPNL